VAAGVKPTLLWIKSGPLHPLDTGGKIRTHGMLRASRRHFQIHFVALLPAGTPDQDRDAATGYSDLQTWIPHPAPPTRGPALIPSLLRNLLFSRLPLSISRYASTGMRNAIRRLALPGKGPPPVLLCDFLTPAINVLHRTGPPPIPSLLFQHNVESAIWQRLATAESRPLYRDYLALQHRRMRRFEARASRAFDGVITVSPADSATFRSEFGLHNVLGDVPTGVDTAHYNPGTRNPDPDRIAFLGSMDWMPNIDGVVHFVRESLPLIRARRPRTQLTIIGRNPPESVWKLAGEDRGIEVTGTVPDVRPFLDRAALLVVPLRAGGGTRIKIFEAAAAGLPVVSTAVGAEGLPLRDGVHLRIADTATEFAEAVVGLLGDPSGAAKMAAVARQLVEQQFGWDAVADVFARRIAEGVAWGAKRSSRAKR